MGVLVAQHLVLRPPRAPPLLAADAFGFLLALAGRAQAQLLDLVGEHAPRDQPVGALRPLALAFHRDAGRPVDQHDAGRDLVHVLPTLAARMDERLVQILLTHAQPRQPLFQLPSLLTEQRHAPDLHYSEPWKGSEPPA